MPKVREWKRKVFPSESADLNPSRLLRPPKETALRGVLRHPVHHKTQRKVQTFFSPPDQFTNRPTRRHFDMIKVTTDTDGACWWGKGRLSHSNAHVNRMKRRKRNSEMERGGKGRGRLGWRRGAERRKKRKSQNRKRNEKKGREGEARSDRRAAGASIKGITWPRNHIYRPTLPSDARDFPARLGDWCWNKFRMWSFSVDFAHSSLMMLDSAAQSTSHRSLEETRRATSQR